jgi:hypothetical protein
MSQIRLVGKIQITDERGQTRDVPLFDSYSAGTKIVEKTFALTADTTATIWHPTSWTGYDPSTFDYLVLLSDGDLDVELVAGANATSFALNSMRLKANTPFILGADDAYADRDSDTDSAYGGTLTTIDKIRVKEPNSAAVNLRLIMVD